MARMSCAGEARCVMCLCVSGGHGRPPSPAVNLEENELPQTVGGTLRGPWDDRCREWSLHLAQPWDVGELEPPLLALEGKGVMGATRRVWAGQTGQINKEGPGGGKARVAAAAAGGS